MTPQRFINRTLLFLLAAGLVGGVLHQIIWRAFQHNPWLNGLILAILVFGIVFNLRRILRLKPETRWLDAFRTSAPGFSLQDAPRLLARSPPFWASGSAAGAPRSPPSRSGTSWIVSARGSTRTAISRSIFATF